MDKEFPHENYPTNSVEAFMVASDSADRVGASFDRLGEEQGRSPLSDEEKAFIFDKLRGGISYFYDLAHEAGALAGQGDAIGALSLLGGESNARDLLGDEDTDMLLELVEEQVARESQFPPEL